MHLKSKSGSCFHTSFKSSRRSGRSWGGRLTRGLGFGALCAAGFFAEPAHADVSRPALTFKDPSTQGTLGAAYALALTNLLDVNTVPYDASYNATGFLKNGMFIRAGGGYSQPWTRDATINSWNAASLLEPEIAYNTLWAVIKKGGSGLMVNQDNQLWDQVIWVTGAWNHYLVTGDQTFLQNAYETATNTLNLRKKAAFNASVGLYQGQAFFNDGVAGYPVPPADTGETHGSGIIAYPGSDQMMVLSTNTLYYQGFRSAALMASALTKPAAEIAAWNDDADALKAKINEKLWIPAKGMYGYLIYNGQLDQSEEGTGESFAILFGIADTTQAASIFAKAHIQPYGIVDVYPSFPRYSDAEPGRHNNIVWPMIQGYWAHAAAQSGNEQVYAKEVKTLAGLANANKAFSEIYHAQTGKVDGGWQTKSHWNSAPNQTWSATAYIRMIYNGLFGINYDTAGIAFTPLLPTGWGDVTLKGVKYRGMTLDLSLTGAGKVIQSFKLDGVVSAQSSIPTTLTGSHSVEIVLGAAAPVTSGGSGGSGGAGGVGGTTPTSGGVAGSETATAGAGGSSALAGAGGTSETPSGNAGSVSTGGSLAAGLPAIPPPPGTPSSPASDSGCSFSPASSPGGMSDRTLLALMAVLSTVTVRKNARARERRRAL